MSDKEVKTKPNVNKDDDGANIEQSAETQAVAADAMKADAGIGKLSADLEELRQTLLRRQADFDNYRKRIEKERFEDSKRATARVVEGLIPVLDGFEHALAEHREAEYENYRNGPARIRVSRTRAASCHGACSGASQSGIERSSELKGDRKFPWPRRIKGTTTKFWA